MGIVDFAHKAYQSESGYEALLLFPMDSLESRTTEGRQRKGWRQTAARSRSRSQSRGVEVKWKMDILIWCTLVYHMEIMEIKDGSSRRSGWS